jgi:hypothetical protein
VAAFARAWTAKRHEAEQTSGRGTFVPLAFSAGEAFQFDWSEDWAVIAGERTKLQVAHFKLSHCRAFLLRAYLLQTHEMLFDAHNHAFSVLGGVPRRGIYDNMLTSRVACWAFELDAAYMLLDDHPQEVLVDGPVCLALTTVRNVLYGFDGGNAQSDAAIAEQVALHVLPSPDAFMRWRDVVVQRLVSGLDKQGASARRTTVYRRARPRGASTVSASKRPAATCADRQPLTRRVADFAP